MVVQTAYEKIDSKELMEKSIFNEKVEKGLAQLSEANMLTHDQVKQIIKVR